MCRCLRIWRWCLSAVSICPRKWSIGSRTLQSCLDKPMLIDTISGDRIEGHRPFPRVVVTAETWRMLAGELAEGRAALIGLWGDIDQVHMALLKEAEIVVVTVECRDGKFPSVGKVHTPAIRL